MGVDITMRLIDKKGNIIINNLYDGRDTDWFNNLMDRGHDSDYDSFYPTDGIPAVVPDKIKDDYEHRNDYGYYGFSYIPLDKYIDWYDATMPQLQAGWFSTYDVWRIEKKNYHPDPYEVSHYLPDNANPADYHFKEYINEYDPNTCVIHTIKDYFAGTLDTFPNYEDYIIVFYFDC